MLHAQAQDYAKHLGWELGKVLRSYDPDMQELIIARMKASAGYKEPKK